jgi:tetratricopeptide (TPR) repeat protein
VTYKKLLARQPNYPSAYFDLAVCYVQLDRLDEARAAVTEMRRLQPLWSPEGWRQMAPYKDSAVLEQDIAALRKAGW